MNKLRFSLALSTIVLCLSFEVVAQNFVESALMFSRNRVGGSARIQGLGGAQVSLGGDFSSGYSNPAGLGMYNRSEISITPAFTDFSTNTSFLNNKANESLSKIQIPGFGIVFNVPGARRDSKFIGGSFAVTLNRINDFNYNLRYTGANENSSIIESFIDQAFGQTINQFNENGRHFNTPTGLAYYNFLIGPSSTLDPAFPEDEYFTDVQENFEDIQSPANQQETIRRKGAINQWSISYGANFSDRIFLGGGIGITSIRYEAVNVFQESYAIDNLFNSLSLQEDIHITGSGINATLGMIARPAEFLQVGFSYTTPTLYQLTDTYRASMDTSWDLFDYYGDGSEILTNESAATDRVISEYNLTVPSKISAGITLISKLGFITTDIEYSNPSNARYTSDIVGISYSGENDEIRASFSSSLSVRVGAEYRYDIFRARAGYGVQGNAYNQTIDGDNKITTISGGVGARFSKFYIDFALIHSAGNTLYQPYNIGGFGPLVDIKNKITSGMLTLGFSY